MMKKVICLMMAFLLLMAASGVACAQKLPQAVLMLSRDSGLVSGNPEDVICVDAADGTEYWFLLSDEMLSLLW